ncbi:DUF3068 domain-containing protein [Lipingzhangella sp. LS1_29]|uniref:DUF3068 domain-containing protein n=1 Tax=Lipingzhangella rawalii TaxID=2055835 RepID=A0ABU2HA64_9ACTN|nr:DUF3068 domain-containing protein [Lipingzhangella rawalii]MDS1272198.1 DUF3068 domain-containing protein [Lipingzhangella rawalii]
MRRNLAIACIALGVFAIVLAPLLRFWVADALMRTPMDYYQEPVHQAQNATYFNIEDVELVEDATIEAHTTLRADVAASDTDVVVWDQFTWVRHADSPGDNDFAIESNTRRVGHDRFTGEAVDCCDASVNEESVVQTGQAYKFPFLTEQRDYEYFDTTTLQAEPMVFDGVDEIKGHETYRFVQEIPETKIDERVIPADVLGIESDDEDQTDITTDEMYSVERTFWIDPITGVPLNQHEHQRITAHVDGQEELVLIDADLQWTDETIDAYIDSASQGMTAIPIVRTGLPIVLLVAGGILTVGGVILYLSARRV